MYTYLRGYASGAGMKETLKALAFAREKYSGQLRKSGEPYIVHPLTMACNAVSMGIKEDAVIATIILHDVCEDCGVTIGQLPVSDRVKHALDGRRDQGDCQEPLLQYAAGQPGSLHHQAH